MGILDEYRTQVAKDKEKVNNDFPENSTLSEKDRSEYEKCLNELRNNSNDIENAYIQRMAQMKKMNEKEMEESNMIKVEEDVKFFVKHVYCEDCGEELISKTPQLFNPYTLESICKHTCSKCGKVYNLEHAYPRIVFLNNKGEEIPAFTR